jgi:hypothetical protein
MINKKAFKIMVMSTALLLLVVCLSYARTDHREYKDATPAECRDCHGGAGIMSNHGGPFFVKEHRLLAQKAGSNCADCHQQSFCLDCHKGGNIDSDLRKSLSRTGEPMPTTHRSSWISIHPIKAKDDGSQSCYRCHEARFCSDCHNKIRNKGSMNIKSHQAIGNTQRFVFTADHAAEARRNLQSCQGCHPDAVVCSQCHNMKSGKSFRSR